jgi:hypothetical protein
MDPSGDGVDAAAGEPDASLSNTPPPADDDANAPRPGDGGDPRGDGASGDASDAGAALDAPPFDLDTGSPLTTFTLLDTTVTTVVDGQPVTGWDPIPEGSTIDLAKVGTALSIRANTTPAVVGSVAFVLDGTYDHTENVAPYTLCSDDGTGTVTACPQLLVNGSHTLTATAYTAANLAGTAIGTTTLYFTISGGISDGGVTD